MVKRWLLLLILSLWLGRSWCQRALSTFTLNGTINARDSGWMLLMPVNTEDYYPAYHGTKKAMVIHGHFSITDSAAYPEAYMIGLRYDSGWSYISNPFFVEPGINNIRCDSNRMWESPAITNGTMDEYRGQYHRSFDSYAIQLKQYNSLCDSLDAAYRGTAPGDQLGRVSALHNRMMQTYYRTLLTYVKTHTASYAAFWMLVNSLNSGYDPLFDSIYPAFSAEMRNTYTGKILAQKLATARITCVGCKFPDLRLANLTKLSRKESIFKTQPRYTLVEFWFSHCSVCIDQFPQYKDIYADFAGRGFDLIGISTDRTEEIPEWEKIIREHQLPWRQYLDENGVVAGQFAINGWPSNFLLDENGVIIQKNIEPATLKLFLNDHLR
jgi:peroxiredoxin